MGKLDFISILCLSLALLANPLIGMQYCTVHHHFLENLSEAHVHEFHHEITPSRSVESGIPSEICGCAVHEHSGACESMIPAEFFAPESLSGFFLWDSGGGSSLAFTPFSQGSVIRFRPGQNGFWAFSTGKVRTHLLKSVLVI